MNKVYIVAACRTPVGRFLGALKTVSAVELAALTVRHNLQQAGIDPAWIDEVICGCVLALSLIHISEPTRPRFGSRMPSSA